MIAEKRCFGTGKAKGHGCKKMVDVRFRKYGLGISCCYTHWLLGTPEGVEVMNKSKIVSKKRVDKEQKKKHREAKLKFKEDNKTIRQLINEARIPFHKYIRIRDANNACISCGLTISEIWDAGHFYKAELYTGLIFDEDNCHKQCRKCNSFLGGNENNYRIRLIEVYGQGFVNGLDEKSKTARLHRFSRDELKEIKRKYAELNRKLCLKK